MSKTTYPTFSADKLRRMCIDNGWFTAGSNEQYNKLFEVNADFIISKDKLVLDMTDYLRALAVIIWLCSKCADEVDIYTTLVYEYRNMIKEDSETCT